MSDRLRRVCERYPGLFPYGTDRLPYLSAEAERTADLDARLRSVWMFLVRDVMRFSRRLKVRELAHAGPEDAIHAVVAELIRVDPKFDPARGRYISFSGRICRHVLGEEREKARVVAAPANALQRLRDYRLRARDGTLTAGQVRTMKALERALGDTEVIAPESLYASDGRADLALERHEEADRRRVRVVAAVSRLESPYEAAALGGLHGLHGAAPRTARQVAASLPGHHSAGSIRALERRALAQLRAGLADDVA